MTLYEMTEVAKQLYEMLAAGDIPEEAVSDTIESFGVEGKVEDYCRVIYQLNADVEMYENEIKRLTAKAKAAKKGVDRMKSALSDYMTATQKKKLSAGTFTLSFRKSESVVIMDENALPTEYIVEEVKIKPNKKLIKNAIKNGETVNGAELQENQNLQIK